MQLSTIFLATLAAGSQAMPAPAPIANASANPDAEALATLQARQQTCTPNGAVIFYPDPNYQGAANALTILAFQKQESFCQLTTPIRKNISFKSFYSSDILVNLYKSTDCTGQGRLIGQRVGATNPNADESGYLSFQVAYLKNQ